MTPTRQKFNAFRAFISRKRVRVVRTIRIRSCWLVRSDSFACEMGRERRLRRSRLSLGILARIAGGYPFCFAGPGERPVGRTTGELDEHSSPPPS
jgi:hypothetical protein